MKELILLYTIGALVSWLLVTGWFFANVKGDWIKTFGSMEPGYEKEQLGTSIAIGFIYGLLWPICLPIAYCFTGFAHYGWRLK